MHTTSSSLLDRLRTQPHEKDWERFVALYTPLFCLWARKLGVAASDVDDVVQDVMAVLVTKLPDFIYDPQQRLRGWLWTILANKVRADRRRSQLTTPIAEGVDPVDPFHPSQEEDREYRQYLVQRALELIRGDFEAVTWEAFQAQAQGEAATSVAARLGVNVASVYAAKSRILKRLRVELEGLFD